MSCSGDVLSAVSGHAAVAFGAKVVVFGGMNLMDGAIYGTLRVFDTETYALSPSASRRVLCLSPRPPPLTLIRFLFCHYVFSNTWSKPVVEGAVKPPPRNAHALVRCAPRSAYLFGGSSPDDGPMNDFFRLDSNGEERGGIILSSIV